MFHKETNFQESPIGKIPIDWTIAKMGEVAEVKGRIGWRGLKAAEYTEKGPYLIANKHIVNNRIVWERCDHLSEFRYNESPEIQLRNNDVVISKDGTIGQPAFIKCLPDRATLNSTMMLLRVTNDLILSEFLFHYLLGPSFRRFLSQKVSGTSIPHLFQRDMKEFKVAVPSVAEQRAIVGVLGVVDSALELADRVIAKTERLKKGLMQQLLTHGIGHTEYKQTPIGRIPKKWDLVRLGDISSIKTGPFGSQLVKRDLSSYGVKIYEQENVLHKNFARGSFYISLEKFRTLCSFQLLPNDVLLTRVGSLGNAIVVPNNIKPGIIGSRLLRIRADQIIIDSSYLATALDSPLLQRQLEQNAHGATRKGLNTSIVKRLTVPLPPITEQKKINGVLLTANEKLALEKEEKSKLLRVKRGLMDLLLTGKVRIRMD